MTKIKFNPADWTMAYDREHWFPFTEDEHCNITGPGHQDKEAFARLVTQYDEVATGKPLAEDNRTSAADVSHEWAVPSGGEYWRDGDEYLLQRSEEGADGAVAVTTIWGHR